MSDISERFTQALSILEGAVDAVTPHEAAASFEESALQDFWRDWPHLSSWAGKLWRLLNDELEGPAAPLQDPDLDEVGGEG